MKTILCFLALFVSNAQSQLALSSFYGDAIVYKTNEIVKISSNCEFGFCQKKVIDEKDDVIWLVLPDCDKGEAELSKEKYKY